MNIAVVDDGANLVAFERMDGAYLGSVQFAQLKAIASAKFPFSTRRFGELAFGMSGPQTEIAYFIRERDEALEREKATSEVLSVISQAPGELKIVFESILSNAVRLCGAKFGNLFLREGDGFRAAAMHGAPRAYAEAWHRDPVMLGLSVRPHIPLARLLATRQIVHITDVAAARDHNDRDPRYLTLLDSAAARTMLLVPMLKEDGIVGAIVIYSQEVRPYSERQIELVQDFAAQAVIAIENTRQFNETQEALERQTATADILKVIASSPSDVKPEFEAIVASANRLLGGFSSTVYRFIDGQAHLQAFTPTTPEADEILKSNFPLPLDRFAPFEIAQAGDVAQIPDTEILTGEILTIARARGFRSMLFAPLVNKGNSIGIVAVTRVTAGTFADHHVQLL